MLDVLGVEVVVPLRWDGVPDHEHTALLADMTAYLGRLSRWADVTVVDGTGGSRAVHHRQAWVPAVRVLRPQPPAVTGTPCNGKVVGALTGVRAARHEQVVLADDDVRYDEATLAAVVAALAHADLVRPQNVPTRWPWHARWDFSRALLSRAVGHDWPGTFGLRRSTVLAAGGWADDVLFENLELVRTVRAAGGRVADLDHVAVGRVPPSPRHFLGQRVRQAYDELARPWVLLPSLLLAPTAAWAAVRAPWLLAGAALAAVGAAERGRRRRGTRHVPRDVPLWAPLWLAERAVCVWWAMAHRLRGGMPYAGQRLRYAARTPWWAGPDLTGWTGVDRHNWGSPRMTVRHTHRRSRR